MIPGTIDFDHHHHLLLPVLAPSLEKGALSSQKDE